MIVGYAQILRYPFPFGRLLHHRMMHEIPSRFPDLCALLWPVQCIGCGFPDRSCCARCMQHILGEASGVARSRLPQLGLPEQVRVEVASVYTGLLKEMLLGYKHGGQTQLLPPLSWVLGKALARLQSELMAAPYVGESPVLIVPLPSTPAAVRKRGFMHLDLLVRSALRMPELTGRHMPMRLARGLLRTSSARRSQVGLRAEAREINAARIRLSRRATPVLTGRNVVLVDDIVTTGASMRAAYRSLSACGAQVVGIVALCQVPRADRSEVEYNSLLNVC